MINDLASFINWVGNHKSVLARYRYEPVEAKYGDVDTLSALSKAYLNAAMIRPYCHQVEAATYINNSHVILTTPTASGKTVGFELAVCECLNASPKGTVLALYPAKAVAHDQLLRWQTFANTVSTVGNIPMSVGVLDGDTSDREANRQHRMIISNPHSMHCWLAGTKTWPSFLKELRVIIIDEAHSYSGVLGSHVALVLRRLLRLASLYGNTSISVIAGSATIANPVEHLQDLLGDGKHAVEIRNSGAGRGGIDTIICDSTLDRDFPLKAMATAVKAGINTIGFCRSRQRVEQVAADMQTNHGLVVPAYRAGYSPEERHALESKLRTGQLKAVVSTSALEVGIDIGQLSVVNVIDLPTSIAGLHQQLGRAGRRTSDSLRLIHLDNTPLARYYANNPERLIGQSIENSVASIDNFTILTQHIRCAGFEAPLTASDSKWFGTKQYYASINHLVGLNRLRQGSLDTAVTTHSDLYSNNSDADTVCFTACDNANPALFVSLLGKVRNTWTIVHNTTGQTLEQTDGGYVNRELFLGASWIRSGVRYRVVSHDPVSKVVTVVNDPKYWAQPLRYYSINCSTVLETREFPRVAVNYGAGSVVTTITGYRYGQIGTKGSHVSKYGSALKTTTFTNVLSIDFHRTLDRYGTSSLCAVMVQLLPLVLSATLNDVVVQSTVTSIYLADAADGGSGVVWGLFSHLKQLADAALELLSSCNCTDGCPNCVMGGGSNGFNYSKRQALRVAKMLVGDLT
jgi:DEAD/DEAH box helicase domain-containing protein